MLMTPAANLKFDLLGHVVLSLAIALSSATLYAQTSENTSAASTSVIPSIAPPAWSELSADQQSALRPLKKTWTELSDVQRRKWIAVIKNFNKLSAQDQEKIQDRMEDWASLKPSERERARDNFASAKLTPLGNKSGRWEEYQALPQDERNRLAAQTTEKKPRAAKSHKTAPKITTQPVPSAPANYPFQPAQGDLRMLLTPSTLLPLNNDNPR